MTKFPRPLRRLDLIYPPKPIYFVTCCTFRRRAILANMRVHTAFVNFAESAQTNFAIAVGRYVILPDHLHLFVTGMPGLSLGKWVGALKRFLAKAVGPTNSQDPVWQRGFFDHVLRSAESYSQKWDYICENPVRGGLVTNASEWPFAGEIVTISHN